MFGQRSNSGLSTVVGAILILALIVSVVAVIKLTYVPDMKKQAESEYMQQVADDISTLKAQLDSIQSLSTSGLGFTTTARVKMGGGALPILDPTQSTGTISMDPDYGSLNITAYFLNETGVPLRNSSLLGHVAYNSGNSYFVDQQISYEGGMSIISQLQGNVMLSSPSLVVYLEDWSAEKRPVIMFNPQRLNGTPVSISSNSITTLRASLLPEHKSNVYTNVDNVKNITFSITSDFAPLWASYFNKTLSAAGMVKGTNYTITPVDSPEINTAHSIKIVISGDQAGTVPVELYMTDSIFNFGIDALIAPPVYPPGPSPTPTPTQDVAISIQASLNLVNQTDIDANDARYTIWANLTVTDLSTTTPAYNVLMAMNDPVGQSQGQLISFAILSQPSNPQTIQPGTPVTYSWLYSVTVKKNNKKITFGGTAKGDNTAAVPFTVELNT